MLTLARAIADTRLSPVTLSKTVPAAGSKAARSAEERRRQCPDALVVRAVEALGRVYMHREAALVGDVRDGAGGSKRGGGGGLGVACAVRSAGLGCAQVA